MWCSRLRSPLLALAIVAACRSRPPWLPADIPRTRADADQLLRKIAMIATHGLAAQTAPRRTPVTESEVNSFLEFHARERDARRACSNRS